MAMTPEDFEIFKRHLEAQPTAFTACPVCSSTEWEADGPVAMPRLVFGKSAPSGVLMSNEVVPVAVMFCRNCFFVRNFLWGLVKAKAKQ